MIIGIIPARAGSKGIKNKNIMTLNGKPLISWTIGQMKAANRIDEIYVSSDSDLILSLANDLGVGAIKRPDKISGDSASSESAWLHALSFLKAKSKLPELLVLAQATSPVRLPSYFDDAINQFYVDQLDSMFSCNKFEDFNYWEERRGVYCSVNYDFQRRKRRQNISSKYHENGSFYLTKPSILEKYKNRLGGKIGVYEMPLHTMFQLDEPSDIPLLDLLLREYCD